MITDIPAAPPKPEGQMYDVRRIWTRFAQEGRALKSVPISF